MWPVLLLALAAFGLQPQTPRVAADPSLRKERRKGKRARINRSTTDAAGTVRESPRTLLAQARRFDPQTTLEELTAARLIASERDSGNPTEWAAIVDAELNRARRRKKPSLFASLTSAGTFGRQGRRAPGGRKRRAATRRDPTLAQLRIARRVLSGELRGVSRGATRFFDPRTQERLFRKGDKGHCPAQVILKKWSFALKYRDRSRCQLGTKPGRDTQAWVGPIPNIDARRLMLFRPMKRGSAHTRQFEAARELIRSIR